MQTSSSIKALSIEVIDKDEIFVLINKVFELQKPSAVVFHNGKGKHNASRKS